MILRTCIVIACLFIPSLLLAAEQTGAPGMIIHADVMTQDSATDLIKANGKVEMSWQDLTMTADEATYNRTNQVLTAKGNVYLVKGGDILWGDSLVMDTETGRAEMENGRIFTTQGNFRADGKQIARLGDDNYALRNGGVTTCDAAIPSWKFGASALDVTLEEYATGKSVVFYVKDIPVFYFPYIILPVKRERQSGFLFPEFGASSKRGTFIDIPFYWAISPSQEAAFNLDLQTKRGVGLGANYHYLLSRTSEGALGGYLIYDNLQDKFRGQITQSHQEFLPDNLSFISHINYVSDKTFLQDYGNQTDEYNRQYYDSRVVVTKFWDQWLASAQAIYTQNYYAASNTATLQRTPELSLYGVREQVPYIPGLYFDMDLLATNYYREKGMQGQRFVLKPRLTNSQTVLNGRLNFSFFGGVQLRGYNASELPAGTTGDKVVTIPEAGAQVSSSLSRLYDVSFLDYQRLRHELVPSLSYLYVGDRDQNNVPLFDQVDRTAAQNMLTFSLASHLDGRLAREGVTEYRDLMTLRLLQSYSLSGTRPDLLTLVDDNTRHWSNLILESETWLDRDIRLLFDARYSYYDRRIASTAAGAEYNDQRGNTARLSYRMSHNKLDYLEAKTTIALTNPVYLSYTTRYSFDRHDFLESHYTIEYRHQCWSVIAGYKKTVNDHAFTINFNLAGLFNTKTSPTAKETP